MNYTVEDFTVEKYRGFLTEAKRRFIFSAYDDIPVDKRHILLRHDLDLSVFTGHEIALIEHELGVSATYFILLHSPFYNLLELKNFQLVKDILRLGHKIGLHFDSHFYNITDEDELNDKIAFEKNFLNKLFDIDIKVFSFHLTNSFTMQSKKPAYGGLINAYSETFQSQYEYCSDSYGVWRFKRIFDVIKEPQNRNLQILTHPEWWTHGAVMPERRIRNIVDKLTQDLYTDADKNYIYKPKE